MAGAQGLTQEQLETALAWYRAELNERLVVHWTGGAWRVPLSTRHLPVAAADGSAMGRLICAEDPDLLRAMAGLRPVGHPLNPEALAAAMAPHAALMARLRALEGVTGDRWDADLALRTLRATLTSDKPVTLLSAADRPISELAGRMAALATGGVLWKPAPRAAASAHLLMRALAPLLGPAAALLQGDHASGGLLARAARPLWLGQGSVPTELGGYSRGQEATLQAIFGSTEPSAASSRRS